MIAGRAGGLHQEHVLATHVFLDLHEGLAIGERLDGGLAQFDADVGADGLGQGPVGGAAKDLHNACVVPFKRWLTQPVEKTGGKCNRQPRPRKVKLGRTAIFSLWLTGRVALFEFVGDEGCLGVAVFDWVLDARRKNGSLPFFILLPQRRVGPEPFSKPNQLVAFRRL